MYINILINKIKIKIDTYTIYHKCNNIYNTGMSSTTLVRQNQIDYDIDQIYENFRTIITRQVTIEVQRANELLIRIKNRLTDYKTLLKFRNRLLDYKSLYKIIMDQINNSAMALFVLLPIQYYVNAYFKTYIYFLDGIVSGLLYLNPYKIAQTHVCQCFSRSIIYDDNEDENNNSNYQENAGNNLLTSAAHNVTDQIPLIQKSEENLKSVFIPIIASALAYLFPVQTLGIVTIVGLLNKNNSNCEKYNEILNKYSK